MADNLSNNKRIAKNTIVLYVRMLFTMGISLYTTRVILNILGANDYGIYNVIGGLVAMFGFLSNSLSAAISRFLTFELGTKNQKNLSDIFSSSVIILSILSAIILILVELFGIWFLNYKMTISTSRLTAANYVLHLSSITFVINLLNTPYIATIIAHEKMTAYAWFTIIEAILKLAICGILCIATIDKLIDYAVLIMLSTVVMRCVYYTYCRRNFEETNFNFVLKPQLLKKIFSFAGWNLFGSGSSLLREQGVNVLLNLFYGPIVNAARGIAAQVNSAVNQLSYNLMTAINPQITKNYATNNISYTFDLVIMGAKYTMFLLCFIALPIIYEAGTILNFWLGDVPDYTITFVRLILVYSMFEAISYSMVTLMLATGNIKKYQIVVGGCQLLNFPIAFMALYMGCSPESTIVISIFVAILCLGLRLKMLNQMICFPISRFLREVLFRVIMVLVISIPIPLLFSYCIKPSLVRVLAVGIISLVVTAIVIYQVGISTKEREFVNDKLLQLYSKIKSLHFK